MAKGETVRKPATLKDVAAIANVSRATAARALNSYGYVGDETAQKVHAAAEKLGYRGNRLAQALAHRATADRGLHPWRHTESALCPHCPRYRSPCPRARAQSRHRQQPRGAGTGSLPPGELQSLSIRGFIVAPTSAGSNAHLQRLIAENVPLVLIDRVAEGVECDSIVVDNWGGARKAIERLIPMGHRRIGAFAGRHAQLHLARTHARLTGCACRRRH
ncbi:MULTISPECIES: LacI family DNA-binding transcriptional regulator [unclassified Sinorhizobium]|uniref:LacI family DNA-binding transcriptional regulator n=1 Tax=unclassified Sinorhizobium TaxID=2613772 RepID=UPI003525923F